MKNPKKVCLLKHRMGATGGLEKSTWRIAHAFAKKGCDVTIVSSDKFDSNSPSYSYLNFAHLPCQKKLSVTRISEFDRKAQKFLLENHFDIVFGMDRNRFQTHLRLGNGIHRAYLESRKQTDSFFKRLSFNVNPLHRLILSIEKESIESKELRALFTNSHMVKDELFSAYDIQKEKVHVIHNGVEWKDLEYDFNSWLEKKPKHCASLKLDPSTFHFLFIGNGYRRKGLDVLLKALSLIQHEDFHLSVIGKDKEINFYMHLAKKLHLENKVSFFGEQKEIKKFYQIADCLVIPSFYDPFANVTVEALAMGLFVVSSISNGGSEVLQESSGITLSSLLDIDELSSLLKETLSISKTWIRSQKIRESVKHLDFSQQTATLVDISLNS